MSLAKTINYDNASNFSFDAAKIEIAGGLARLKLIDKAAQEFLQEFTADTGFTYDSSKAEFAGGVLRQKLVAAQTAFSQDFTSDVGFTYDAAKAEFVGGVVRQKDFKPANATLGITYDTSIDAEWGNGTLTGTAVNGATVSGGKLDCSAGTAKGVTYPAASKFSDPRIGSIKFKYTPNYNGAPAAQRSLLSIVTTDGASASSIDISHNASVGQFRFAIYNSSNGTIFDGMGSAAWLPSVGVEYEIEFCWDFVTGSSRIFVNGIQIGTAISGTGAMTAFTLIKIGLSYNSTLSPSYGYFNDVIVFSDVQHVSGYTPGYSLLRYQESIVVLPAVAFTKVWTSFAAPTITEVDLPKYIVNGYYWNGAAWVTSSNTYATAMSSAQWIANIATFPVTTTPVIIKIIFADGFIQDSVSDIAFTINQASYVASEVVCPVQTYSGLGAIQSFDAFSGTEANSPKYTLNGKYWTGAAWGASDGTYAQASSLATINTNILELPAADTLTLRVYFNDSNTVQMSVTDITTEYTGQEYPQDDPYIVPNTGDQMDSLENVATTMSEPTGAAIKFILVVSGVKKYFSITWQDSDGSYAQSNTLAEVISNKATLNLSLGYSVKLMALLHSNDGSVTPTITQAVVTYDYSGGSATEPPTTYVYGYLRDILGSPLPGVSVSMELKTQENYDAIVIIEKGKKTTVTDANGYFEFHTINTTEFPTGTKYEFVFYEGAVIYKKESRAIPNVASVNYSSLAA
jgi:hypothetical protein